MGTYQDEWVLDRTMFEYVNQGGCSCCGLGHSIMDLTTFAMKCSDWESDDSRREKESPWPGFVHEEVLGQRVAIRMKMKEKMPVYKLFWQENGNDFTNWWIKQNPDQIFRMCQAGNIIQELTANFDISGAYKIVICAVIEQIKHRDATGYTDARSSTEEFFEKCLVYERNGFTIKKEYFTNEFKQKCFIDLIVSLGGPSLLPHREKDKEEQPEATNESGNGQSFRSDRRLIRRFILCQFVDNVIQKYKKENSEPTLK